MRHAFLILTYSQPEAVLVQVLRMATPNRHFYIHINRRTLFDEHNEAYQRLLAHPQVTLIANRIKVLWGSYSAVEAHLALIDAALQDRKTDYFHLISGECLPVKAPAQFNEYFKARQGSEFILIKPMPQQRKGAFGWGPNRIDKYHFYEYFDPRSPLIKDIIIKHLNIAARIGQRLLKKVGIYRRYPATLPRVHVGSTWWSLTPECCQWIQQYVAHHPALTHRFHYTQYPEEMLFHTIIAASPFRERVVNDNLRFIEFVPGGSNATPISIRHLPLLEPADILIARKFTGESTTLIEIPHESRCAQRGH